MPSTNKLNGLAKDLASALKSFAESHSTFRMVRSIHGQKERASDDGWSGSAPDRLYVLDSSFNPPTRGHLDIALSALKADASPSKHMLLLLATQNADKQTKPAAFEQRLVMMDIMAHSLIDLLKQESGNGDTPAESELTVHIGVTKHPYFIDKSHDIAGGLRSSSFSPPVTSSAEESSESPFQYPPTRQTHLIGFDTFTRLMDPKYYGPEHNLKPLAPLFADHSVRVTLRTDDGFGSKDDQTRYVDDIAAGKREADGAEKSWAEQVQLTDGINVSGTATSSTRAREAAKSGNKDTLVQMCGEDVAQYVLDEGLYKDG